MRSQLTHKSFHSYHIFHNGENTEFILKGRDTTSRQFQKGSVGSILVLVIPQQSRFGKMCQSERLMKLRNGYRLKRSHFTPHLSDVTLSGPRARLILFGGSNTTQFCGWHRRIQNSCYKCDYISPCKMDETGYNSINMLMKIMQRKKNHWDVCPKE